MSNEEIEETFRREVSKINKKAENKINLLDNYVKNNPKILEKCFIFVLEMDYGDLFLNKLIKYLPEIKHTMENMEIIKIWRNLLGEI